MGPKSRKSLALWQLCEVCSSTISSKDLEMHCSECAVPLEHRSHCFISNKVFYAKLEEIKSTEVEETISDFKNDLIFMSQSAMQMCGFLIGDPVVIASQSQILVRKAWPKIDGALTACKIYNSGSPEINQNIFKEIIKISNFLSPPIPLREVNFLIKSKISNLASFLQILQFKYKYKIFNKNASIYVPFYGQLIHIVIVETIAESNEEELNLSQLSLHEQFYIVMEDTKWNVINTEETQNKTPVGINLNNVGGYKSIISDLKQLVDQTLRTQPKTDFIGDHQVCTGILLYGCHGTGKTLISQALANYFTCSIIEIKPSDILSSRISGESLKKLNQLFAEACSKQPCIILIDNIDILAPNNAEGEEKKTLAALTSCFDMMKSCRIVVIATSVSPENTHPSLRRPARLENEIEIAVPSEEDRKEILCKFVPEEHLYGAVQGIASITHGYVGADLAAVVSQARSRAMSRESSQSQLTPDDLSWAVKRISPSAMRQAQLQINKVKWEDIGGQENLKMKLKQAVEWPLLHPDVFSRLGITPPRGILMFGPPGCSKTMIAKAIATETSLNFLSVKGSDIFSKWVGESERAVRELFGRARRVAPSVVFLDEVDALCPCRDGATQGGGSAVQDRVLSQLLTEMDGVQPLNNVIVIAATNRPDRIDKAFLRPGRLDRLIYVPLPSYSTRLQILQVKTSKTPLASCVDLNVLSTQMEGYSGAEVVAVCNEAAIKALEEDMSSTHVKMSHFHLALKLVTPRTPPLLLKIYEDYVNKSSYRL